jgi:hypothetical protein
LTIDDSPSLLFEFLCKAAAVYDEKKEIGRWDARIRRIDADFFINLSVSIRLICENPRLIS